MMDFVRSSYDLGEHFTETRCQTKDIGPGRRGTMSDYWIAPDGCLYLIDYSYTADFVELKEGDVGYDEKRPIFNFQWIPNGNRGKVSIHLITKPIVIYPEQWEGTWESWPHCRLNFEHGKLVNYEHFTER